MIVAQLDSDGNEARKIVVRDVALKDRSEIVIETEAPGLRDGIAMTIQEALQMVGVLSQYLSTHYTTEVAA